MSHSCLSPLLPLCVTKPFLVPRPPWEFRPQVAPGDQVLDAGSHPALDAVVPSLPWGPCSGLLDV